LIHLANKLKDFLEPLIELHKTKLNSAEYQEEILGSKMASDYYFDSTHSFNND